MGNSKEDAKDNLVNLKREIVQNSDNLGDDAVAKLEVELMRRMQELGIQ